MKFSDLKVGQLLHYSSFYSKEPIFYVKGFGNKSVEVKEFSFFYQEETLTVVDYNITKDRFDDRLFTYKNLSSIEDYKLIKDIFWIANKGWEIKE
jgi:hypothetical protein